MAAEPWFCCVPQGRNAAEQVQMIQQVEMFNSSLAPEQQRVTVSVEIEKTREPLYQLFPHGDLVRPSAQAMPTLARRSFIYLFIFLTIPLTSCFLRRPPQVFVSKDVARHFGFGTAEEALRGLYGRVREG